MCFLATYVQTHFVTQLKIDRGVHDPCQSVSSTDKIIPQSIGFTLQITHKDGLAVVFIVFEYSSQCVVRLALNPEPGTFPVDTKPTKIISGERCDLIIRR